VAPEPTFTDLLNKARQHDREAVAALYRRALPVIYRFVYAHLGQPELVEDVVSDVFLVMVESIEQLRTEQEAGFYAWLIQIAHRKVAHAIAQVQRHRLHEAPLPDDLDQETDAAEPHEELADTRPDSDPAAVLDRQETVDELQDALHTLSQDQQVVLAGQSVEDLAQALHKRPGAVRALQFRALGKLAERLGFTARQAQESRGGRHAT
jgi:RNA polymerase sigma factor (sigma-70 family)